MAEIRYITSEDVLDLATPAEHVEAVREGYRQRGAGAPTKPRTQLYNDDPAGRITSYISILPEAGVMGGYVYSAGFDASNAWFTLPLFDAETGALKALIEGGGMNPLKTGAASAVAIDELARKDAHHLAVIGSGRQARGQLRTVSTVRDFEEVSVYSRTKANRDAFADEFNDELEATVTAVGDSATAIENADVVITATWAAEPVFDGAGLSDGAHVTAMGQYHPEKREIDAETVARSTYVLDLRERAQQDAGAFILANAEGVVDDEHIHAELGEVLVGDAPGRTSDEEITVFDSGGTAIETVAAAQLLYERAVEADRGQVLEFSPAYSNG